MAGMFQTRRRANRSEPTQRSETARERRNKRSADEQKQIQYATERRREQPARVPVVTRRGDSYGMATPIHPANRSRRRFDIAIGSTGGEVTVPSLPVVNFGWRAVSGMLLVLMLVCAGFLVYSPTFKVETLDVKGLKRVKLSEINQAVGLSGEAITAVDPAVVVEDVKKSFSDFSDVKVSVGLPASVHITVVERTPVLRWTNDSGEHWVDQEGYIFPARGDGSSLPLVQADILPGVSEEMLAVIAGIRKPQTEDGKPLPASKLDAKLVKTMLQLYTNLPKDAPLLYQPERGFGWTDQHGWSVYFGRDMTDLQQKQTVYAAIVNYLVQNNIKPVVVSVENPHAPYYRMER